MLRKYHPCVLACLILVVLSIPASGQQYPYNIDMKPPRGIMPNSEQLSSPLDSIDPISGKLSIQIPLASLPPGNAGFGFDLSLAYDSHIFDLLPDAYVGENPQVMLQTVVGTSSDGGWNYNFKNYKVEYERRVIEPWAPVCDSQNPREHERIHRYRIALPDGSQHTLHLLGYAEEKGDGYYGDGFYAIDMSGVRSNCAASNTSRYPTNATGLLTYYTTDGSFLRFQIQANGSDWRNQQWTLLYPDGRRVIGKFDEAQHIYDANGNGIHVNKVLENSRVVTYISDDYSRNIRIEHSLTASATEKVDKITVAGPNNSLLEWRIRWQKVKAGGTGLSYVCYEDLTAQPNYIVTCPLNRDFWVVKQIQLPFAAPNFDPPSAANAWQSYEFGYDPAGTGFGRVTSMRVPSGAQYIYCCDGFFSGAQGPDIAYAGYGSRQILHDGQTNIWTYVQTSDTATVTNPDGGVTRYTFYDPQASSAFWSKGLVHRIDTPDGSVRKRQWTRNKVFGLANSSLDHNNAYVERESVTVDKAAGQPRTVVTDYLYDKNGNLLRTKEYDWSNFIDSTVMETPGALLRQTDIAYYVAVPGSSDVSNGPNRYWSPTAAPRLDALVRKTIGDGAAAKAITEFEYDNPLTQGNVRFERRWDDTRPACTQSTPLSSANCLVLHREYSAAGNLLEIFEPDVHTELTYDGLPYPTLIKYASGTPSFRSTSLNWNVAAGVLNSETDVQNGVTTTYGYDNYGRRNLENEAGKRNIRTDYYDELRTVVVKHDLRVLGDAQLQTVTHSDEVGRVDLLRTSDGAPLSIAGGDGIKVRTIHGTYAGGTRVVTSTPYRATTDPTLEWTCTQRDAGGRITAVSMFRGSDPPTDCQSVDNRTGITLTDYHTSTGPARIRVTDPTGAVADRYSDALGRLETVVEAPGTPDQSAATYRYNLLDNLTRVTQGVQQRDFEYTSLGRLKSVRSPETQNLPTFYEYTDAGDIKRRVDPRGVFATLTYDDLHRVIGKSYAGDGGVTPEVTYEFHSSTTSGCANVGQLREVRSSVGKTAATCYDALGRVTAHAQEISGGPSAPFSYSYLLNDRLQSITYPSGKVVASAVDNAGRVVQVGSATKMFAELLSGVPYTADGRITKMRFGNDLWETWDYRAPGTPTTFRLRTLDSVTATSKLELEYHFAPTSNNGNLISHVIRQPFSGDPGSMRQWTQEFTYDGINRLSSACERPANAGVSCIFGAQAWRQQYGYDEYGNRRVAANTPTSNVVGGIDVHEPSLPSDFQATTNRLFPVTGNYDAAGNQRYYSPYTLVYDAENRIVGAQGNPTLDGGGSYAYDGNGRRVKKVWSSASGLTTTTYYLYNVLGQLAVEYNTQAPVTSGTTYFHPDLLGSIRMTTGDKPAGGIAPTLECYDYLPFGRLIRSSDNGRATGCYPANPNDLANTTPQKFTGQTRDSETRLDYFPARYFSSAQGRWLSPDWNSQPTPVPYATFTEPQTLNLYSYTRNNPFRHRDADGHCCSDHWRFFKQEIQGVWDTTGGAVVETVSQIASGQVITNVKETYLLGNVTGKLATAGEEFVSQSVGMVKRAAKGDPRAIGQLAGTIIAGKIASTAKASIGAASESSGAVQSIKYPPNLGFAKSPHAATLLPGSILDRYGATGGRFLSPQGTPLAARSLPAGAELRPLHTYEVVKPFPVDAGVAAPWFNQSGGGIQFYLGSKTVQDLLDTGHIRAIP